MLHVLQIFDYFLSFCASLEEVAWRVVSDNFDIDALCFHNIQRRSLYKDFLIIESAYLYTK